METKSRRAALGFAAAMAWLLFVIILIISVLLIRTGFAYALRGSFGQEALWWSFPAGSIASLLLAIAYYRFGNWRSLHMMEEDRPATGLPPDTGLGVPRQRVFVEPEG